MSCLKSAEWTTFEDNCCMPTLMYTLFLPSGLIYLGLRIRTSTVTDPTPVCASVSSTQPRESIVTVVKLSLSTAVCYHNYNNLGFEV